MRRFSDEDDAKILLLHTQDGYGWTAIANELGGRTGKDVKARFNIIQDRQDRERHEGQKKSRKCLRCDGTFVSEHFGHRVCENCSRVNCRVQDFGKPLYIVSAAR